MLHRQSRIGVGLARGAVVGVLLVAASGALAADGTPPERASRPASALAEAIKRLTEEARQAKAEKRLGRSRANFAKDFGREVPRGSLANKIRRRLHRDPFIDAYVRWQLTSFQPTLPQMSDREFERFLADLPRLLENPRADESLIASLGDVVRTGPLTERELTSMRRLLDDLAGRSSRARALNQPALAFRAWVERGLPAQGAAALQVALEQAAALVDAGWPVDRLKARIDERCRASAGVASFTDEQRRRVAKQAHRLAGRQRLLVTSARIEEETLAVNYGETAVYDFDVRRWVKLMRAPAE